MSALIHWKKMRRDIDDKIAKLQKEAARLDRMIEKRELELKRS